MTEPHEVIRFYRHTDPWGELSNFAPYSVLIDDVDWPTSEHWFQAQKVAGTPYAERIRRAATPWDAAELGRDRSLGLPRGWHGARDQLMKRVLMAKFTQHEHCRAVLLGTGDALLVEHTPNDRYWGDGGNGSGQNRLGLLLMEVRAEVRDGAGAEGS